MPLMLMWMKCQVMWKASMISIPIPMQIRIHSFHLGLQDKRKGGSLSMSQFKMNICVVILIKVKGLKEMLDIITIM